MMLRPGKASAQEEVLGSESGLDPGALLTPLLVLAERDKVWQFLRVHSTQTCVYKVDL